MGNSAANSAREKREDISRFVVHLTRDDTETFTNGATARANFITIMDEKRIAAMSAHCLHHAQLPKNAKEFRTACFTETPLNQIGQLVGPIPGRKIKLEAYGFVFLREFIVKSGGQPAIYINSYDGNTHLRDAVNELFRLAQKGKAVNDTLSRLLPFINAMHERYDFTWEREWRVLKGLSFTTSKLVCVILPEDDTDDLRPLMAESGIAAISPGWSYEQIVAELSKQQRATRSVFREKIKALNKGRKASDKKTGE